MTNTNDIISAFDHYKQRSIAYIQAVMAAHSFSSLYSILRPCYGEIAESESDHDYMVRCLEQDYDDGPDGALFEDIYQQVQTA